MGKEPSRAPSEQMGVNLAFPTQDFKVESGARSLMSTQERAITISPGGHGVAYYADDLTNLIQSLASQLGQLAGEEDRVTSTLG